MNFHIGQRIVCIDAGPSDKGVRSGLVKGRIYTISGIFDHWDGLGLQLNEILTPNAPLLIHFPAWRAERFRPIIERKTDISIFTAILVVESADA